MAVSVSSILEALLPAAAVYLHPIHRHLHHSDFLLQQNITQPTNSFSIEISSAPETQINNQPNTLIQKEPQQPEVL